MAAIVTMPKLSDTMEEGGIASWLIEEGDSIEEGDPLVEIETDKATMEYSSPEEGVLLKIIAKPGDAVALDAPIAVIGEEGEDFNLDELVSGASPKNADIGEVTVGAGALATPPPPSEEDTDSAPSAQAPNSPSGGRIKASPLAKKIAASKGIDLNTVKGSGPNGRIIQRDLEDIASSTTRPVAPSAQAASQASRAAPQPQAVSLPQTHAASGEDVEIPLSMMRKTIAKRLLAGKNEAPHFYLTVSADMSKMIAWRKELNGEKGVGDGSIPKVSMNDLIMLATAKALRKHPAVNSSWQGDKILQHGGVHMCMAVALPTGLVTPVIRNCDQLSVREIAQTAKYYGAKARAGELTNEDFAGGTFTVSNLGMTKVEEFTAIINPPQAGILAVGTTQEVPWVQHGQLVVAQRMKMTLSSDHRVVDGMVGAQFLETLVQYLENPVMMLA